MSKLKEKAMIRKLVVLLGFAVTAALMVSGMASASAVLCSTNTNPCTGTKYGSGTKISAQQTLAGAVITTSTTTISCAKSTIGGATTTAEGHGEISSFTFGECKTSGGTACTVKAVNLNYTLTMSNTGGIYDEFVISRKFLGSNPGMSVECGALVNCTFTSSVITLSADGDFRRLIAESEPLARTGGICPSEASWDAQYEVTSPFSLYIV
jgi:hypothetical protein